MAREFNGTTDRIDYGSAFNTTGQPITISAWVYFDTINRANSQYIFNSAVSGGGFGCAFLLLGGSSGQIALNKAGSTALIRTSNTGALSASTWTHILLTHDGVFTTAASVHIYVNGVEVTYAVTTNGSSESTQNSGFSIGGRVSDDIRNIDGQLAEVGVWNRVLSSGEIVALADGVAPIAFSSSLKLYSPLVRSADGVFGATRTATLDGTTVTAHPPMRYPGRVHVVKATAATTDTALSVAGAAVGTLAAAARLATALSGTGAAVGTLTGSVAAVVATTDLSTTGAATVTGVGAARVSVELDTDGAAVGTLASASLGSTNLSSTAAATATADITDAGAYATTRLDSTGAATANAVGIVTQSGDLTSTGAGTGTAATATRVSVALSTAGAAIGTLEGSAVSGYLTTDLSAAAVAVGTMAGAATLAAALSAAGTARARGDTGVEATQDYLTWGAEARRIRQLLEEDDDEVLQMVATMLPMIKRGSHDKSYSRSSVRRSR